jgi:hypothetical protein
LRLLQLLGGGHDYDASAIRRRIDDSLSTISPTPSPPQPEANQKNANGAEIHQQHLLVPESLILAARSRNHPSVLRLLVHRLGDYDTAVSYCIRGAAALTPAGTRRHRRDSDSDLPPTWEQQNHLFRILLGEFLALSDSDERLEQTSALLERFGRWFDVVEVLELVPEGWAVKVVSGFLVAALRGLVCERREAMVERALSGVENLRVGFDFVVESEKRGPVVEREQLEGGGVFGIGGNG